MAKRIISLVLVVLLLGSVLLSCGKKDEKPYDRDDVTMLLGTASVKSKLLTIALTSEDNSDVFSKEVPPEKIAIYSLNDDNTDRYTLIENAIITNQTGNQLVVSASIAPEALHDYLVVEIDKAYSKTGKKLVAIIDDVQITSILKGSLDGDDIAAIKELMDSGKSIFDTIGKGIGFVSSGYSVLQTLGLIERTDAAYKGIVKIQETLDTLDSKVSALSNNLQGMYTALDQKLSEIGSDVRKTLFLSNQQTWTAFQTDYVIKNGIQGKINALKNTYESEFIAFTARNSGTFSLFYDEADQLTYPVNYVKPDSGDWMSVDGKKIDDAKTVSFEITADTFRKTEGIGVKHMDDSTYLETLRADFRAALLTDEKVTEANVDKYVEDAFQVLSSDTLKAALNRDNMAAEIVDNFLEFCEALTRATDNPISAYQYTITANFNFQSEAAPSLQDFNDYLIALLADYKTYADTAVQFGNISTSNATKIQSACDRAVQYLEEHNGLVEERQGSQYCYITNSYLKASQFTVTQIMTLDIQIRYRFIMYTGAYNGNSYSASWDRNPATAPLITGQQLRAITAIYSVLKPSEYPTFRDYFIGKFVSDFAVGDAMPEGIIGAGSFAESDFVLDNSVELMCQTCCFDTGITGHPGEFFTKGKIYPIGSKGDDSRVHSSGFVKHKTITADVLNLKNGSVQTNFPLIYGAIYGESKKSWQVDECWIFSGVGGLSSPENWTGYSTSDNEKYDTGKFKHIHTNYATFWGIEIEK